MLPECGIICFAMTLIQTAQSTNLARINSGRSNELIKPHKTRIIYTTVGCYLDPEAYIEDRIYGPQKLSTELQHVSHALQGSYSYPFYSPFSPVCFRCAICICIIEKLNETLNLAHGLLYYKKRLENVTETLRSLCRNGFDNYELRSLNDFHIITDSRKGTKRIPCYLDGKWKNRLRTICHDYLDSYGEVNFYNTWLENSDNLIEELCRGGGLLRDCSNVPIARVTVFSGALAWPWTRAHDLQHHFHTACP